jgi:MutS domain V
MPMKDATFPLHIYTTALTQLQQQLARLQKKRNTIAWLRLGVIFLLAVLIYYCYPNAIGAGLTAGILLLAVFLKLVIIALNNKEGIDNTQQLIFINQQEINIANNNYTHLDSGTHLQQALHPYTNDLDVFGRASLYQYFNRTTSQQGNKTFAYWLQNAATVNAILLRQHAVKELAAQPHFRQQLQAYGMQHTITFSTADKIAAWAKEEDVYSNKMFWKLVGVIYPAIAVSGVVAYNLNWLPVNIFFFFCIGLLIISAAVTKKITPNYKKLDKIVNEIMVLANSAALIEGQQFKSVYLQQLQQKFISSNVAASQYIKKLKAILDRFDYRLNPVVFIPLNALVLWDLQIIFQLESWRKKNKQHVYEWFTALGEIETINTVANIYANHPAWVFPEFNEQQHGIFAAKQLGHPLLDEAKRIDNNFTMQQPAGIALITGSNMAGKSTFLRSIGVNTIMAMMGAPVCAASMLLSPMRIISSMRVADNLEESTSTFYAELKKLKYIIECINRNENVFVLLDEILRGTNSVDRHTGTKALIKQLIKKNAIAVLATHDVELAQLENEYKTALHNYHFDVQVAGEELYFDYKLKEGVCTSLNASILMKKIGIEI